MANPSEDAQGEPDPPALSARSGARRGWQVGGRRLVGALVLGLVGLSTLTTLLDSRADLGLGSILLLYLLLVVIVAVVGGPAAGLSAAVAADLLVNWYFIPPYHTLLVDRRDNVVTLLVFVAVAGTVAALVEVAARERAAAGRSQAEASVLAGVAAAPIETSDPVAVLEHIRTQFEMTSVALVEGTGAEQRHVAAVGQPAQGRAALDLPMLAGMRLVAHGPASIGADRRTLTRLGLAASRAAQGRALAAEAARAEHLAAVDRVRSALLAAVGHDLRTPLAGIKAAVSGLRQPEVEWTPEQSRDLLATIEDSADRLDALVANLLDMSRLQAGALSVALQPVSVEEVVVRAALEADATVTIDVAEDLPPVRADPGLLERVVANLVDNARRFSPPGRPVELRASLEDDGVRVRVVDHGPGVPASALEQVFTPFQRLDDRSSGGVGLGLAIARGFCEAMGVKLEPSATRGGGLTMTLSLPLHR